ncbi:MAG: hypothetical protein K9G64_03860 [Bacteroidia bacterium]|nr:hypothetical protein [Bacteroidia bacterium]
MCIFVLKNYFAKYADKYFAVGKIQKDQVKEYAKRKNVSI